MDVKKLLLLIGALAVAAVVAVLDRELGRVPSKDEPDVEAKSVATSAAGP